MIEIRTHGRGGQGSVIASEILADAFFRDGKFVQAFPAFGVERRGAPVMAFTRVSESEIVQELSRKSLTSIVFTPAFKPFTIIGETV